MHELRPLRRARMHGIGGSCALPNHRKQDLMRMGHARATLERMMLVTGTVIAANLHFPQKCWEDLLQVGLGDS